MLAKNWKKYIPVVLLVVIQCQLFRNNVTEYGRVMNQTYEISIGDYIVDFYKGVLPFVMGGDSEPFNIPAIWSLYFIYFFAIIGYSVSQMSQRFEIQMTMRCVKRKRWWMYQNYALWLETIGYLLITYLSFYGFSICTGTKLDTFHEKTQLEYNGLDMVGFRQEHVLINLIVISILVMVTFAYIQYAISLKTNTMIGILASVAILVVSVFKCHPALLSNYLMLFRQKAVMLGGVQMETGIALCMTLIVLASLAANNMLKTKDLF